jgi:hypothetical protein
MIIELGKVTEETQHIHQVPVGPDEAVYQYFF